mmetsp:Transcript_6716/g.21629  ORF Transcript_6716/g.21629 Transcript_6716/m.21629 type:complete len:300 (-) Transcript_6716:275-1174(-)
MTADKITAADGCPVAHDAARDAGTCPVDHGNAAPASASRGKCPVDHEGGSSGATAAFLAQAGVDPAAAAAANASAVPVEGGVELDPRNHMPKVAEQRPWPGQSMPLSTHRKESVIPKSEFTPEHQKNARESSSWIYPSEQQFYNAMKRKGWKPREEDMKIVLSIHNHVNDRAWSEVMRWEQMHACECDSPKLLRFMGKPKELSPKATVRTWLGYSRPFDRHDWIVDRCGKEVRYIIDFYQGAPPKAGSGQVVSMFLDARPALDSWGAFVDRARMQFRDTFQALRPAAAPQPPQQQQEQQ